VGFSADAVVSAGCRLPDSSFTTCAVVAGAAQATADISVSAFLCAEQRSGPEFSWTGTRCEMQEQPTPPGSERRPPASPAGRAADYGHDQLADGVLVHRYATLPLSAQIPWTLKQSGVENVPVTVYLRFLGASIDYVNFTADIILDEQAPIVKSAELLSVGEAPRTANTFLRRVGHRYAIRINARDAIAGICEVEASSARPRGEMTLVRDCHKKGEVRLAKTVMVAASTTPKYLRVRNSAGSWSRWRRLTPNSRRTGHRRQTPLTRS
jgi:hypothetical protein